MADQEVCFVIMGFGTKTDYESGRKLDLDKTYQAIIKPAVEAAGLRCIRADEVKHSGIIDRPMYEMLLRADVVIADISTGNPNAIYELGVRHGLRTRCTIIMKENGGKLYFDLDHANTLLYKHLGEDIGFSEAKRATSELLLLIKAVLSHPKTDSPVYTYLSGLSEPSMSDAEYSAQIRKMESLEKRFEFLVGAAKAAAAGSEHQKAAKYFESALTMAPDDPYLTQQLALHTYKSKVPDAIGALNLARQIIDRLDPETTTDSETLGIAGAILKNLWVERGQRADLDLAIVRYRKGFEVRTNYYTGENYALCLDLRSAVQADASEAQYDRMTARKTRERIVSTLSDLFKEDGVAERGDYKWMLATMSHCLLALGRTADAVAYEQKFRSLNPALWEIATFEAGRTRLTEAMAFDRAVSA